MDGLGPRTTDKGPRLHRNKSRSRLANALLMERPAAIGAAIVFRTLHSCVSKTTIIGNRGGRADRRPQSPVRHSELSRERFRFPEREAEKALDLLVTECSRHGSWDSIMLATAEGWRGLT